MKAYPSLAFFISGELKLPTSNTRFSELTSEQKINFTALYKALNPTKIQKFLSYKEANSVNNIINNYEISRKSIIDDLNGTFRWMNVKNFFKLQKTLISEFGLSENEALQCVKYLNCLKKNPQFGGNFNQQADMKSGLVFLGIGMLLGAL